MTTDNAEIAEPAEPTLSACSAGSALNVVCLVDRPNCLSTTHNKPSTAVLGPRQRGVPTAHACAVGCERGVPTAHACAVGCEWSGPVLNSRRPSTNLSQACDSVRRAPGRGAAACRAPTTPRLASTAGDAARLRRLTATAEHPPG